MSDAALLLLSLIRLLVATNELDRELPAWRPSSLATSGSPGFVPTIVTRGDRIRANEGRPVGASDGAAVLEGCGVSGWHWDDGRANLTERERGPQREPAKPAVTVARTAGTLVIAPLFVAVVGDGWWLGQCLRRPCWSARPGVRRSWVQAALTIALRSGESSTLVMPWAEGSTRSPGWPCSPTRAQHLRLMALGAPSRGGRPVSLGATTVRLGGFNVLGTIVGVLFIAVGVGGLSLAGASDWAQAVFTGAAVIVAVAASTSSPAGGSLDRTGSHGDL